MNLYLISQTENTDWDTYDSAVVAAETEAAARQIHPDGPDGWESRRRTWASTPETVTVQLLGEAASSISGVICASFHAG